MVEPDSIATIHLNALYLTRPDYHTQRALKSMTSTSSGKADINLQNACQEMESIFINYLFKEMRATINRSGFVSGGTAENIYTSMLDMEILLRAFRLKMIGISVILGIVPTVLSCTFYSFALEYTTPTKAGIMSLVELPATAIIGHFFLGEYLFVVNVIGIIILLT